LTAGKTSQRLQGDFNTEAGLNQLLSGTGLGYVRQADGGYALRLRLDAVSLPTQKVKGENPDEEEVYRAPRSSVYISADDMQRFGVVS
ncbi:STN domain-containing protein, partial [Burkholderia sp. SIMBA_045]